jgi:protocatechuate 3,4-dioxygenase beta subunit
VNPGGAQKGLPLTLVIDMLDANAGCAPFNGAHVDIWHANASGLYSDEAMNMAGGGTAATDTAGQDFLRGYQITGVDSGIDGRAQFKTIWPGWYTSRAIHIHVRVRCYDSSGAAVTNYTTQIFLPDSQNDAALASSPPYNTRTPVADPTTNATDTVLVSTDDTTNVITAVGNGTDGYRAYFPIALETSANSTTVSTTARTRLEHVTVSKSARGARSVAATIKTNAAVTVVAELERADRIIGHARGHLRSGAHTVRISISKHAVRGAATLVVKVTDAGHHTATYRHRIHIPPARA